MDDQTSTNERGSYRFSLVLLSTISILLSCWYLTHLWRRRKLYISSWVVPGPFALPFVGNVQLFYKGIESLPSSINNLTETYPELCRIWLGPNLVYILIKPEDIEMVLCNELDKAEVYKVIATGFAGYGLLFLPANIWKRHRKIIMPSFNQHTLDSYVETFNKEAEILCDQLQEYVGEEDNHLFEKLFKFAIDIVCGTLMGVEAHIQTSECDYEAHLNRALRIGIQKVSNVWYHIEIIWMLSPLRKEMEYLEKKLKSPHFRNLIVEKVTGLRENSGNMEDAQDDSKMKSPFLEWILKNGDLTETELIEEVDTFIGAGTDTLATSTSFTLMTMGMFQDIQEKVYEEVMEICGPDHRILPSDINKLKYTKRVVKETLRLFPPAPIYLRAINTEVKLGKYTLAAGASALFFVRAIHLDPRYWPNPYKFDPDRFLPENVAGRHPCSYITFSYGPRNCIGNRFAMMVLLTTIANLVRRFKFYSSYKTIEEIEVRPTIVLKLKEGTKVTMELR